MSMVVTQELLTIFAKYLTPNCRNMPMKFVYEIYDYFIQKGDSNYIFFMAVALIGLQEKRLV